MATCAHTVTLQSTVGVTREHIGSDTHMNKLTIHNPAWKRIVREDIYKFKNTTCAPPHGYTVFTFTFAMSHNLPNKRTHFCSDNIQMVCYISLPLIPSFFRCGLAELRPSDSLSERFLAWEPAKH